MFEKRGGANENVGQMRRLTKRQAQVQGLLDQKLSTESIAAELGVTVRTVNTYAARMRRRLADTPLTKRELETAALIRRGLADLEISKALSISARTVEVHRQSIMAKYKARSTPHLMAILYEEDTKILSARISELEATVAHLESEVSTLRQNRT